MMGLASDGGLLLPEYIPELGDENLDSFEKLSYQELAYQVMSLFIDDIDDSSLKELITKSYSTFVHSEITPVNKVGDFYVLELFHGPTLAFKDVALQFLGNLFSYLLRRSGSFMNILGATSGDTGSAAIYGVKGKKNINIFILHPHGRVSRMQALQMTTVPDENVFNLAIEGTFDDCQAIVKSIFNDLDFKERYRLGAINSINWARILAQVVYYLYSALKLRSQGKAVFSVPTGNFGDIFAGLVAKKMAPSLIKKLILATNENDILTRFVNQGIYKRGKVVQTISPSMDIQIASNFERYLFYLFNQDPTKVAKAMEIFANTGVIEFSAKDMEIVSKDFASYSISQDETKSVISQVFKEHGYLCDPHTAVGVGAAMRYKKEHEKNAPLVCLSTAHPCKFPEAVLEATGIEPEMPERIRGLESLPRRYEVLPPSVEEVKDFLQKKAIYS